MTTPTPANPPPSTAAADDPTPLAKAYAPAQTEPAVWRKWLDANAFHADPQRVLDCEAPPYTILIPPPNVTAALHLGHALNNTIQDILARAHRMKGFETLWMPGTDHAGIATQTVVDRRLKAEGKPALAEYRKMEAEGGNGRERFVAEVQAFKDEYERRITEQLRAMGCSCDWERQRFTMDAVCARAVREAFFRLFRDGLIERGKRLVNWDPATQTALADDEVEMEEVDGAFYDLRYPLVHPGSPSDNNPVTWGELAARGYPQADQHPEDEQAWVTVATTRPETYLGDVAVAVNPADPRAASLRGLCCRLPIVGRIIPVIEDEYVVLPVAFGGPEDDAKAQMSTGFLKVTPAHDPNDYELGRRHAETITARCSAGTTLINVMAPDATISDRHGWTDIGDAHLFVGKAREEARAMVIAEFKARAVAEGQEGSLLERVRPHRHSVGHSYRSHAIIEPYLSDQWYCRVTDDRLRGVAQRAMRVEQRTEQSLTAWPESAPFGGPARRAGSSSSTQPPVLLPLPDLEAFQPGQPLATSALQSTPPEFTPRDPFPKGQPIPGALEHSRRNLPHLLLPDATYFITWRAQPGRTLNSEARDVIIDSVRHRHGDTAMIDAIVVMPDHAHALLRMSEGIDLRVWIADLKRYTARRINEVQNQNGSVWQDEHFDRIVRDPEEYADHLTYIAQNPIKAGLTKERHEWRHCLISQDLLDNLMTPEERPTRLGEPGHRRPGSASRSTEDPARRAGPPSDASMSFHPARYARNYESWHDNLRDWCISRQLWWGHRIPVWSASTFVDDTGSWQESWGRFVFAYTRCNQKPDIANFRAYTLDDGAELALGMDGNPLIRNIDRPAAAFVCLREDDAELIHALESRGFRRDPDVLDTWFSSALWPLSTMGWPDADAAARDTGIADFPKLLGAFNPTSVLTTAREIITLWVSRMVMFNRYFLSSADGGSARRAGSSQTPHFQEPGSASRATPEPGPPPFKDIFIHAMIQDGEGRKMSKSLGNGVDPLDIIESHGADAMRFTLCQMTTQTQDVRVPVEKDPATGKNTSPKFDIGRNLCNKLWNAARFALAMLDKHPARPGPPIDPANLSLTDRWMLSRVVAATASINTALRNYQFKDYADALYDLLWRDFCDWYLESVKPTLATDPHQPAVLRLVLDAILRLMHPVTPFITEALHERVSALPARAIDGFAFTPTKSAGTLCRSGWPEPDGCLRDEVAEAAFDRVRTLVTAVREVRASKQVPPKRRIVLHTSPELGADIARWSPLIETLAGVRAVTTDPAPPNSAAITFEGAEHRLSDLTDGADAGAERDRLLKELAGIEKSVGALEGRLANPGYAERAPPALVQQTRDELAGKQQDASAVRKAIKDLG